MATRIIMSVSCRKYVVTYILCLVIVCAWAWPVIHTGQFQLLDCPQFVQWTDDIITGQMPFWRVRSDQARPSLLLVLTPIIFSKQPAWLYSYQTVAVLFIPLSLLAGIVLKLTGRIWLSLVLVVAVLGSPAATENYFTLFKQDPYILLGCSLQVSILWILFQSYRQHRPIWRQLLLVCLAVIAVLLTYGVKETGGGFYAALLCGVVLLSLGNGLSVRQGLAQSWWLLCLNTAMFLIVVMMFLQMPHVYRESDSAHYAVNLRSVAFGTARLAWYFLQTSPAIVPALFMVLWIAFSCVIKRRHAPHISCRLAGWIGFALAVFLSTSASIVPWTVLEARHYLVPTVFLHLFCCLVTGWLLATHTHEEKHQRSFLSPSIAYLIVALQVSHCAYGIMVGVCSEGRVRVAVDRAYSKMFLYLASNTPLHGVVYVMADKSFLEIPRNAETVIHKMLQRPDITCSFPIEASDISQKGMIAVSRFDIPINYDRIPVQHEASVLFHRALETQLNLMFKTAFVYETRIWYATNAYHGPQYRSVWGVPAFWDLKRGVYRFGWTIYTITNVPDIPDEYWGTGSANRVVNGGFARGLMGWSAWGVAGERTNQLYVVRAAPDSGSAFAVRIENPRRELIGLKQHVPLVSGEVYRLSAAARSVAGTRSDVLFGGRVAVFLPPQPEQQLIWMSEYNRWWQKELVFTNQVTGTAVVYVHLGYGNVATTGEFSSIRLERIERTPR